MAMPISLMKTWFQRLPTPADTHQDVVWLDVSMNYLFRMNEAEAVNELAGNHQYCLEREFAPAKVKEVFQTWAEEIKTHKIKVVFSAVPRTRGMPAPSARDL